MIPERPELVSLLGEIPHDTIEAVLLAGPTNQRLRLFQTSGTLRPILVALSKVLDGASDIRAMVTSVEARWGGSLGYSSHVLARWLIGRSAETSPAGAVEALESYLDNPTFPYKVIYGLAGVIVDGTTDFVNAITLTDGSASRDLFAEWLDPMIRQAMEHWLPSPRAALVQLREVTDDDRDLSPQQKRQDLDDVVLCLTLVGPCAPVCLQVWQGPDDAVPTLWGHVGEVGRLSETGQARELNGEQARHAADLYALFAGLSREQRQRMRVPMRRLNSALRRKDPADAVVDIAIALESLFTPKSTLGGEHAYKVRTLAARYLSDDLPARREIHKICSMVYQLRNTAVHRGVVTDADVAGDDTMAGVTAEAAKIVANTLELRLRDPEVDWDVLALS